MHPKITELSKVDPIIYECLKYYQHGKLTYQETLELMVIAFSEQHGILQKKMVKCLERKGIVL